MDGKDPDKGKAEMDTTEDFDFLFCNETLEKVTVGEKRKLEGETTSLQSQNEKAGKNLKQGRDGKSQTSDSDKEKVGKGDGSETESETNAGLVNLEEVRRSQNLDTGTEDMEVDTDGQSEMEKGTERNRKVGYLESKRRVMTSICPEPDFELQLTKTERQENLRPLQDYLEKVQTDVNATMRGILIDSFVPLADSCDLLPNTIHLAVSYVDRFLSVNDIKRNQLELLGMTSMLIASKYECTHPLTVTYLCKTFDHLNQGDILRMEEEVLKVLNYKIGFPTVKTFLRQFTSHETPNLKLEFLAAYLADLSLLDYDCVKYLPSLVASAALFLARFTLNPNSHPWPLALQLSTGYKPASLRGCILILHHLQSGERLGSLVSLRDKYKGHTYKCVSHMLPPSQIPDSYFDEVLFEQNAAFNAGCGQVIGVFQKFLDHLNVPKKGKAIAGQNEKVEIIDTSDPQQVSDADLATTAFSSGRAQTIQRIRDFLDGLESEVTEQNEPDKFDD